ncbi:MAG: c-type cytochrome [Mucilaginibacter sp.]|uniref:c-type cytochrome n=1 Tax=Mucilaginibacter sp. TaxID=1882438 RepID=UPI003264B5AD
MMNKKLTLATAVIAVITTLFIYSCGPGNGSDGSSSEATTAATPDKAAAPAAGNPKGTGKFTDVKLTHPLDQAMIGQGKAIFDVKCGSCHKLTDEKLVGPGWKGVTDRRQPEWIMNFVTNTDEMIDKDPEAQAMLEKCMVRMPNQHLSDDDARHILEFMRNNDGKK